MQSSAKTVDEYIASLPDDRREAISTIRAEILKVLPKEFEEAMNWGMICYQVPLSIFPDTYNKQPFMLGGLASQKNHMSLYITTPYIFPEEENALKEAFARAGKKLDMGKSCIRFQKLDDIVLEPILGIIKRTDVHRLIEATKAYHFKDK